MTIDELSEAWNELRNAALGRGTKPVVSAELAQRVGADYDAWRDALQNNQWPTDDAFASVTASRWVDRYRELLELVEGEGVKPARALPKNFIERFADGVQTSFIIAGIALAVAVAAPFVARGFRKR